MLTPFQHQNFHIDQCVVEEMNRLKTFGNWTTFVFQIKNFYHSHVIIQALKKNSLKQHHQDINHDPNLQVSYVLCILETRIQSSNDVHNFINTSKYSYISIYDGHGLITMYYNAQMSLHSYYMTTCNGSKNILATFNIRIRTAIHIIFVYKSHFSLIFMFLNTSKTLIQKSPNDYPFIVSRDFNINILDDSNHKDNKQEITILMNNLKLKSQFINITTKVGSQLDHIRSNVLRNESKSSVSKAY